MNGLVGAYGLLFFTVGPVTVGLCGNMEELLGGNFIDPALYQHLFWAFAHPEVYVLMVPTIGWMLDDAGYESSLSWVWRNVVAAGVSGIIFVGVAVWGHHMYSTGLSLDTLMYYSAGSICIGIPTSLKVVSVLIYGYKLYRQKYRVYALSLGTALVVGGTTGIVLANCGLASVLHDSCYVVSHFHVVLAFGLGAYSFVCMVKLCHLLIYIDEEVQRQEAAEPVYVILCVVVVNVAGGYLVSGTMVVNRRLSDSPSFGRAPRVSSVTSYVVVLLTYG